ncbi:hypothetical protein LJC06_04395 [Bacteroidales bacterium OttesenSCG-928-I14]|nr:hypothetical protein [Bacteroidales bacterium OttesenSCG-928-I14]
MEILISKVMKIASIIIVLLIIQAGNNIRANVNGPFSGDMPSDVTYNNNFERSPSDVTYSSFFKEDATPKPDSNDGPLRAGGNMGGNNSNKMMPVGEPGVFILLMLLIYPFFIYVIKQTKKKLRTSSSGSNPM